MADDEIGTATTAGDEEAILAAGETAPTVPRKQTWWEQLPERWRTPAFGAFASVILFLGIIFRQPLAIIVAVAIGLGTAAMVHDQRRSR